MIYQQSFALDNGIKPSETGHHQLVEFSSYQEFERWGAAVHLWAASLPEKDKTKKTGAAHNTQLLAYLAIG